ncbi:ATP-binding protein [Thermovenabulum sp.]|uniref:ATP-binding protein n=1 Tax=Thermovenabulum sp. TaxID=3100335 RepID=UPI003C7B45BF
MKLLKKLLLINWHYIYHEVIEFEMINFLTGKNGAGKSTIIDALQVLILGDTKGDFFNKAANDKSKRTLKSYLRGEIADDGEGGFVVLRSGNFTSYIAGEFYDTVKKTSFSYGVVFDAYEDGEINHKFFYLDSALPENQFVMGGFPLNIRNLRTYLSSKYKERYKIFDSNREYQLHFITKMGSLNEKFYRVFRKSVPFSPIIDIENFISEYVCDVQNKIDISSMQENLRYYKELEYQAEQVKKRVQALKEIEELFESFLNEEKRLKEQEYLIKRAEVEKKKNEKQDLLKAIKEKENTIKEKEQYKLSLEEKLKTLEGQRESLIKEKYSLQAYQKKDMLEREEKSLLENINGKKASISSFLEFLSRLLKNWEKTVEDFSTFAEEEFGENLALNIKKGIQELKALSFENVENIKEEDLSLLKELTFGFKNKIEKLYFSLEQEKSALEALLLELRSEIENLKKGIKPYDKKLLELKSEIETALKNKYRRDVKVEILADLIEVKDKKWHNAVEAYLHTQKFYLIAEPRYFVDALKIYDEQKFKKGFYDIGLVDTGKLERQNIKVEKNSLAFEVVTENRYARLFVDYILGRVVKCERVEELRNYATAITPDCMLYQNYVARQLSPERYKTPYIGKKSLEKLLEVKLAEKDEKEGLLNKIKEKYETLSKIKNIEPITEIFIENAKGAKKEKQDYISLKEALESVRRELSNLDLSKILEIDEKIQKTEREMENIKREREKITGEINKINSEIQVDSYRLREVEMELNEKQKEIELSFEPEFVKETGEPRFLRELENRKLPENIISAFLSQVARTRSQKEKRWSELLNKRSDYNREYKMPYDISSFDNGEYKKELERLLNTELPLYEEKIKDAKEKARMQFQDDFISKLKQNIDTVYAQIEELNTALKQFSFGKDRYKFEVKPNPAYRKFYDMIMDGMLLEGYTIFSIEFQNKHRDALEELFNQIVYVGEQNLSVDERVRLEENIQKFTDYRTYLNFDLVVTDEQGRESRLSRTLLKKSGGETQTPFYISILASFGRIYRMGNMYRENNTLRLIIFDEAFSKMDHQRVQESIKLLRNMGFQAIISAPTEKIQDIATLVDRNLCVIRSKNRIIVRAFDPREVLEEAEVSVGL